VNSQPFVIPMLYARSGHTLYLHGSAVSRTLQALETGVSACVTVTLVDGLVLARSAFHHSINYRSVVAFGTARSVSAPAQKVKALHTISEHMVAGRWNEVRGPSRGELEMTTVVEFTIEEASAKVRHGPPIDDEDDYGRRVWAGVVPLRQETRAPVPDPRLAADVAVPQYLKRLTDGE
jgi:nitroimidazol reductase NimA-like FMN-containing flavoprotein (pyridoxamine 5'-phosphate oxidase superfamily)